MNKEWSTYQENASSYPVDIAIHSKTTKEKNQDAGAIYMGQNCSAVVIADGLGSSFDAHIASELAVRSFLQEIQTRDSLQTAITLGEVRKLWSKTADHLKHYYENNESLYLNKPHPLQTTLSAVISLEDSYIISYVGNGSIIYIRGDFWCFWDRRWPWCVTDFMVGHSFLDEKGKEVLYGILAPQGLTTSVQVLQLSKNVACGEILVLCSDGISSPDHLRVGYDANNKLWVEVNPYIKSLLNDFLRQYFKNVAHGATPIDELNIMVERFLQEMTFDDDATLGIVVSHTAINHYREKNPG